MLTVQLDTSGDDERDPRLDALVSIIREETEALHRLIPGASDRQWSASPVPRPREDTSERSSGDRPADPTADVVLDARRLALRAEVIRSERSLREAAIRLRAARKGLDRAIARFDGEGGR